MKFAANLIEQLVTATFVLDNEGKVMIWNRACEKLTGIPATDVIGTNEHWRAFYVRKRMCLSDMIIQGQTDKLSELYAVHTLPSIHGNGYKVENWCVMPRTRSRLYIAADAGPIYDEQGKLIAVVQTMRDITNYKNAQTALEELSITDELTGLNNRRFLNEHLHIEWTRGIRSHKPLSLIMIDLDYFKQYNDSYGHTAGDQCLKTVARVLRHSLLRSSDMATRYGGEEFCILLPDTPIEGAFEVSERIHLALARLKIAHKSSAVSDLVTLSDGVACLIPCSESNPSELIALADSGLYEAKAQGRNQSAAVDTMIRESITYSKTS